MKHQHKSLFHFITVFLKTNYIIIRLLPFNAWYLPKGHTYSKQTRNNKAAGLYKLVRPSNGHHPLKDSKKLCFKILRNMKSKILHFLKKKKITINEIKKIVYLPPTNKTLHLPSFLLLCNPISHLKDIKLLQFKRKFYHITPEREFFTTLENKNK